LPEKGWRAPGSPLPENQSQVIPLRYHKQGRVLGHFRNEFGTLFGVLLLTFFGYRRFAGQEFVCQLIVFFLYG
jgi:hypothetical protein